MNIVLDKIAVSLQNKPILQNISCTFSPGNMIGIIGPNGSGKSTLLKTLAAIHPYDRGNISINQQEFPTYKRKQIAQMISYVPQDTSIAIDFTVRQVVQMGRHIYQPLFASASAHDKMMVEQAMEETNILHLAEKNIRNLSGGQRQLVIIAKALAQDTPIILLDEPIASLDVYYQLAILQMLERLQKQGKTIIIVLHDLNLAARFCKELLLLHNGQLKQFDTTENVLKSSFLADVYQVQTHIEWNALTKSMQVISEL